MVCLGGGGPGKIRIIGNLNWNCIGKSPRVTKIYESRYVGEDQGNSTHDIP